MRPERRDKQRFSLNLPADCDISGGSNGRAWHRHEQALIVNVSTSGALLELTGRYHVRDHVAIEAKLPVPDDVRLMVTGIIVRTGRRYIAIATGRCWVERFVSENEQSAIAG